MFSLSRVAAFICVCAMCSVLGMACGGTEDDWAAGEIEGKAETAAGRLYLFELDLWLSTANAHGNPWDPNSGPDFYVDDLEMAGKKLSERYGTYSCEAEEVDGSRLEGLLELRSIEIDQEVPAKLFHASCTIKMHPFLDANVLDTKPAKISVYEGDGVLAKPQQVGTCEKPSGTYPILSITPNDCTGGSIFYIEHRISFYNEKA